MKTKQKIKEENEEMRKLIEENKKLRMQLREERNNKRDFVDELILARERNKHSVSAGTLILGKILGYDKIGAKNA